MIGLDYDSLPVYRTIDTKYYDVRFDGYPTPRQHWMFVCEVVDDSESQSKNANHKTMVIGCCSSSSYFCFLFVVPRPFK